jgi:outer membrane protein OmpA-like peptidoglycan-associated protein
VTTELQAFGLIVTAEPYSSTRQPSDVVVLENEIRPDTVGKVQEIRARYELMPRGHYTWEVPRESKAEVAGLPKVSMDRYEALLELYEAQNATEIARAAGAEQYATRTFEKSLQLLENARRLDAAKSSTSKVVQEAREAAQTADDARVIAERGRQEEKLAAAESAANSAKQQQTEAQADAQRAKNWAEAERAARERAEADAAEARAIVAQAATNHAPVTAAPPPPPPPAPKRPADTEKTELRMALLQQLNSVLSTRDTARGLVVTIPDSEFSGSELNRPASDRVARLAAIVAPHAGLRADVEGHTDSAAAEAVSWKRAETVRRYLAGQGLSADKVSAQGLGSSRPLGPNSTANGREQNRRVEIVISGDPIGSLPVWDRTYSLIPRR